MNYEMFTQEALKAIEASQQAAIKNSNPEINELHLHVALLEQGSYIAGVLNAMGVDLDAYLQDVYKKVKSLPTQQGGGNIYPSSPYTRILLKSEDTAKAMGQEKVDLAHLYITLLEEPATASQEIFHRYQITKERCSLWHRSGSRRRLPRSPCWTNTVGT